MGLGERTSEPHLGFPGETGKRILFFLDISTEVQSSMLEWKQIAESWADSSDSTTVFQLWAGNQAAVDYCLGETSWHLE